MSLMINRFQIYDYNDVHGVQTLVKDKQTGNNLMNVTIGNNPKVNHLFAEYCISKLEELIEDGTIKLSDVMGYDES